VSPADYRQIDGNTQGEMTMGQQERRATPTPLFAGRDALMKHPIRERPGHTLRRSDGVGEPDRATLTPTVVVSQVASEPDLSANGLENTAYSRSSMEPTR
jgi:hypothetical protein